MIDFSFRSISFKPPLSSPRRFFIGVETSEGSSQNTEPFTYSPQTNLAALSETLEFLVKDPKKGGSFHLEILEFDERAQKWFKIGKETFPLNKLYANEARDLTLPTIYGTDAVVDVKIDVSDEFRDSVSDDDSLSLLNATMTSLEENLDQDPSAAPKKRSKRERLEKMLNLDRLNVFRTASIYHELIFALTPIVEAREKLIDFFTWKNPQTTYMYSIVLTLFVIYGRYLLAIGLIMFSIFGSKAVPYVMKPRPRPDKVKGKLQVYKQNFNFVRELVRNIVYSYDLYRRAAEDPDRVLFLELLFTFKKLAPVLAVILFIFNLKILILAGYWSVLFYFTNRGREFFTNMFLKAYQISEKLHLAIIPPKVELQQTVEKETLPKSPRSEASTQATLLSRGELTASPKRKTSRLFTEKTFITYENQRWWPGKGWRPELLPGERPSWSDALGQIELYKNNFQLPGSNWHWENDWSYVIGEKTDSEGWEYASRFKKFEDPNRKKSLVHSVRRRKWVRKCIGFEE